jgi:uncharacterized integral membrane protein
VERRRQIALVALGGVGAAFAVLNFDEVEVNWILGTWDTPTPLIVVIALSMVVGAALGMLVSRRRKSD